MQQLIAAIVPVHNGLESTKIFLRSFYRALNDTRLRGQCGLIVVDDGSTDGTSEWIAKHHPEIQVLKGDGGLWWSGSINLALDYVCKGPYTHVLLFNNDNTVRVDFFRSLEMVQDSVGKDVIVSSKVINTHPAEYVIYGGVTFDRRRSRYVSNADPTKPTTCNTAGGMGVLVPIGVVRKVGRLEALKFPQKSGDTDYFLRAEGAGFLVHYQPRLVVYNDNRMTGHSDNSSVGAIIKAYSFPKGYRNLGVDFRLFWRHGNRFWAVCRIVKSNLVFLAVGIVRIIKAQVRGLRRGRVA